MHVFIDLEINIRQSPEGRTWCRRVEGVPEKCIRVVKGIHQHVGSWPPPRNRFQPFPVCHHNGFRHQAPWQMMFADDVVLSVCTREAIHAGGGAVDGSIVEESNGISTAKTEYLNGTPAGNYKMQAVHLPKDTEFKYLGSRPTLHSDADMNGEVYNRIQSMEQLEVDVS